MSSHHIPTSFGVSVCLCVSMCVWASVGLHRSKFTSTQRHTPEDGAKPQMGAAVCVGVSVCVCVSFDMHPLRLTQSHTYTPKEGASASDRCDRGGVTARQLMEGRREGER